jgi:hypothetical protein
VLAAEVDALEVDVEDAFPGRFVGGDDGGVLVRHDPGVVVENIDLAKLGDTLVDPALDVVAVDDVAGDREDRVAVGENDLVGESHVLAPWKPLALSR